jgi:hypothetical protein
MIRGVIDDPTLTLDNPEIARRHITAYLLQRYHQTKLPAITPEEQPQLFAVLGSVSDFKNPCEVLNRDDLVQWLTNNRTSLQAEVASWLPAELSKKDRQLLLDGLITETMRPIDAAIEIKRAPPNTASHVAKNPASSRHDPEADSPIELPDEPGEERPGRDPATENLLDRLLYKGVLPRYAFPTDVASFYVFDDANSTLFRPEFRFTPSQGLLVALTQYAPGKEVWIANKLWTSGAIYSPMRNDRPHAWQDRRLYYECRVCHFTRTVELEKGRLHEIKDCEACGSVGKFGPARYWLRKPGFAHPVSKPEGTSPDDQPARSYATRAKLTAVTPIAEANWSVLNDRIRVHYIRDHLLVTNRGPREEGYKYCIKCGLIEPTAIPSGTVGAAHKKPYPDKQHRDCPGGGAIKGLVLGTDFITDVLLISLRVDAPLKLVPGVLATDVALRTLCEAITKAACGKLELEANELQAEYRPALTAAGRDGSEAELYLYEQIRARSS